MLFVPLVLLWHDELKVLVEHGEDELLLRYEAPCHVLERPIALVGHHVEDLRVRVELQDLLLPIFVLQVVQLCPALDEFEGVSELLLVLFIFAANLFILNSHRWVLSFLFDYTFSLLLTLIILNLCPLLLEVLHNIHRLLIGTSACLIPPVDR